MGTTANITVGAPSSVKIGAFGAGVGAAVDVGYSQGGLTINSATEHHFSTVDQEVGQVKATKIAEVRTVDIIVAEPSLANLALIEGYPTSAVSGGDTLDIGGSDTVTLREVFIVGPGPDGAVRTITLHKVIITGITDYPMLKDSDTAVKISIHLLQDTAQAANKQYYSIVDAGGDTTPPTVAMTDPIEDGEHPSGDKGAITLTFTDAGSAIDEGRLIYGSADNATIFVNDITDTAATALVAGAISYSAATKVLTFIPTENWGAAKKMQIIITTSVRDTAGNYLAAIFLGHFTTAA